MAHAIAHMREATGYLSGTMPGRDLSIAHRR